MFGIFNKRKKQNKYVTETGPSSADALWDDFCDVGMDKVGKPEMPISVKSNPSEGNPNGLQGKENSISSSEGSRDSLDDKILPIQDIIERSKAQLFYELEDEINDDDITDIEWDGYHLWIISLTKGYYKSDKVLSKEFVDNLSIRLSNIMRRRFSRQNPVLEANTDTLRISIWHESRCGEKSIVIRKISTERRFDHETIVESGYAPEKLINLLENCIVAHMGLIVGGKPHAGKTELLKYLTKFIADPEKAVVYEDVREIHYRNINPDKNCAEFLVDDKYGYSEAISAGLRHNSSWQILSESRGPEVVDLFNALSDGNHCLTTVHLGDIIDLPDRFFSMSGLPMSAKDHIVDEVHSYIDVGVVVSCNLKQERRIKQVCFFTKEHGVNKTTLYYDNYEYTGKEIPNKLLDVFYEQGIDDPFKRTEVEE